MFVVEEHTDGGTYVLAVFSTRDKAHAFSDQIAQEYPYVEVSVSGPFYVDEIPQ